jgi:dolichyl-phosphate-mannose-protein mannosyltransferase
MRIWRDLTLLTVVGLVIRLFFLPAAGHVVDLNTFGEWATRAADAPWDRLYESTDANYPPAAMVFFEIVGRLYRASVSSDPDGRILHEMVKLPAVLFDLLGGLATYALARRFVGHWRALGAAALFDLNPAIIYDSALWGQNDAIATVGALAAVALFVWGRRALAWIVLAFAVLNKPPVIVLAPLFLLESFLAHDAHERTQRLRATAVGIAGAIIFAYAVSAPFYIDRAPLDVFHRLIDWYAIGSSLYPVTSANAFNFYALVGPFFQPDTTTFLFVSIKRWADIVYILIAVGIFARFARRSDARGVVEASFLLLLAFFLALTEMHERYSLYALTFAPALVAFDRRYLWTVGLLTLTQWLNLEYSLTYMWIFNDKPQGIDPYAFAPVLARLCALTTIGIFLAALHIFLTRDGERRAPRPEVANLAHA